MMATYWDFRRILDVDPDDDHTCVGIAKTYSRRCKHRVGVNYRSRGSQILDQMDHTKSFSKAMTNLEDLADLLLCKQVHNSQKKPHLNQINELSRRWYTVANEKQALAKRQAERIANSRLRSELSMMKEAAQRLKDDLESAKEEMIAVETTNIRDGVVRNLPSRTTETADDPFFVSRTEETATSNPPSAVSLTPVAVTKINWPVVPHHQPSAKIPVFSDSQQDEIRLPVVAMESTIPAMTQSISKNNRDSEAAFRFGSSKSDENVPCHSNYDQKGDHAEPQIPTSAPGPRKRIALKNMSASTNKNITNSKNVPSESMYEFGATRSPPLFSFEVLKHPPASSLEASSGPEGSSALANHLDKETEEAMGPDFVPSGQSSSELVEQTPEYSTPAQSESFGYAVVTPPSTRYKTYLPARHKHGLMTPPETPENLAAPRKSSSPLPPPPRIGDYFADNSTPTPRAPAPKVTRKPVPVMKSLGTTEELNDNHEPRGLLPVDARSIDTSAGCLSRFGVGRLREKVMTKLKNVKANVSKSTR
ncbi:hypothetical protein BKA61DRAFT_49978 [Leptodontidium sp. MPI-SDFR-AT-0119]|nr:hypothetical protein BKA61DRAFT_49978 [Leptodontidium sp. MPI-SDFR-AT-0119]